MKGPYYYEEIPCGGSCSLHDKRCSHKLRNVEDANKKLKAEKGIAADEVTDASDINQN